MGHSVLDCPLANHTSPTRTFRIVSALDAPTTVRTRFSFDASIASSDTHHLPSAPAWAVLLCPANATVTFSPGSATPHTGTARPRWRTMLSANGVAVFTNPCVANAVASIADAATIFDTLISTCPFPAPRPDAVSLSKNHL